jgi:hypothetical protein
MEEPMMLSRRRGASRLARAVACIEALEGRMLLTGIAIDSPGTINVDVGHSFSDLITTSGSPTAKLKEIGALPSGVKFTSFDDGSASISGIPNGPGKGYTLVLEATNTVDPAVESTLYLNVDEKPQFTSRSSAVFNNVAGGTFTITTSSGFPKPTISAIGLPAGVTIPMNDTGTATLVIASGGVVDPGYYNITNGVTLQFLASNIAGTVSKRFSLTIDETPAFATPASETLTMGTPSDFQIVANGYPHVKISEFGALPKGMTFHFLVNNSGNYNGTATLSGTPMKSGVYPIRFDAQNLVVIGQPSVKQEFVLTVDAAPAFTSVPVATFKVGKASSFTIKTTGYPDAAITEVGGLPSGISFVDNGNGTATLSGTPEVGSEGLYDLTIQAANGIMTELQSFALTIT